MLNKRDNKSRGSARAPRAFTMVEMLIVVAVVILLLSILIVVLNAAARASQGASTSARMQAMSRALVQFRTDIGYLPPILNNDRDLYLPAVGLDPALDPNYREEIQNYTSVTAPAECLTGWSGRDHDGYGVNFGGSNTDSERPPFGIRHPGPDGVWRATLSDGGGTLAERNPDTTGDVFGPYLEMEDPDLLASIDGSTDANGDLNVFFPGDAGYVETNPKVIVDFWGRPIQYFRKPYPIGGIRTGYMQVDRDNNGTIDRVPSLGDIIVLRSFESRPGDEVPSLIADDNGDNISSASLNSAEFALFSPGPDRRQNHLYRYDDPDIAGVTTNFANRDNIVELGR